jgi:hypothetical protein
MRKLSLSLAILGLAAGAAQAAANQHPMAHRHVSYAHRPRAAPQLHLSAEMSDDYRQTPTFQRASFRPDGTKSMVRTDLGRGVYATFGLQKDTVDPPVRPVELDGAADTRLNQPEGSAGVKVGIPF